YHSIDRAALISGPTKVFAAKCLAGLAGGVGIGVLGSAFWTLVVWFVLRVNDLPFQADAGTWVMVVVCVFVCGVAGALGAAVGWILRGYYLTSMLVLVVPLVIELPLMLFVAGVGRFLPSGAMAGTMGVPFEGLLPAPIALAVLLAWTAVAVVAARRLFLR